MKKFTKTFVASVAVLAALLVAADLQAKDAALTKADGKVEVLSAGGSWQKAAANKAVKAGSMVRTSDADGSAASFVLSDGTTVALDKSTSLTLTKADSSTVGGAIVCDTAIDLKDGGITVVIPATSKAPSFAVKTGSKTITVPGGTTAYINAIGDVTVLRGSADVQGVAVSAGQSLKSTDSAPTAATAMEQASAGALATYGSTPKAPTSSSATGEVTRSLTDPNLETAFIPTERKVEHDLLPRLAGLNGSNMPLPVSPF